MRLCAAVCSRSSRRQEPRPRARDIADALDSGAGAATINRYPLLGATGFDMVSPKRGAGRGLLATLNRGNVKLIGKNTAKTGYYMPAAMAA